MKAIYLDAFSGISGNMLIGAFLHAGLPQKHLEEELRKLAIEDEYNLEIKEVDRNGIKSIHMDVVLTGRSVRPFMEHLDNRHNHEIHEEHGHHHHGHHEHRTFKIIKNMIEKSTLSSFVKEKSVKIFEVLAVAEGKVHGKPPEEVAFHEVGAVDSIIDIVGSAIALEYFGIEKIYSSPLNTGGGFVKCAHGLMPVPAPAVAELLINIPHYHKREEVELTTPTGAAFVRALAEPLYDLPRNFKSTKIAYGAGTRELPIPNVLRMYFGECENIGSGEYEIIETNIDDMNPQIYGYLYDTLLEKGALDVWTTPIYMKKNRPAVKLSVLIDSAFEKDIAKVLFKETTSIGFRIIKVDYRLEAARKEVKVNTKYGEVRGKVSVYDGEIVSMSVEYEDCKNLAKKNAVPLKKVRQEAIVRLHERLGE